MKVKYLYSILFLVSPDLFPSRAMMKIASLIRYAGGASNASSSNSFKQRVFQHCYSGGFSRKFDEIINAKNHEGKTPLHIAAQSGSNKAFFQLVDVGANINVQDNEMRTPLYIAADVGNYEVVEHLILAGAKVDTANFEGNTPLHVATSNGNFDMVKLLFLYIKNFHTVVSASYTKKEFSSKFIPNLEEELLCSMKKRAAIKNKLNATAFDIAREKQNRDIELFIENLKKTEQFDALPGDFQRKAYEYFWKTIDLAKL